MTDYVTEMMETAGCKTYPRGCTNDDINEYTNYISNDCEGDCEDCTWYDPDEYYPDFTAEKQLEIIKLIIETQGFCGFTNFRDNDKWSISCGFNFPVGPNPAMGINFNPTFRKCETLEQALAQLTTELMNAGELDKEKVAKILNY